MPSSALHWGRYPLRPDQALQQVKALYDFDAKDENELNFNVGDIIDVLDERSDGWLIGLLNGLSGLVPITYVEKVNSTT
jgi:hypothetical protein